MNQLIAYGSVDKIPFYNCTWKSEEEWWQTGIKRPLFGMTVTFFGILVELLYLPVMYIIITTKLIQHSCYKLIVMLICTDMCATACIIVTGSLLIQGAVFCSYPTFIYVSGTITLGAWCAACVITICLFINRILSIVLKDKTKEHQMVYLSVVFCVMYFLFIALFTPTICYNSVIMAWLPDPLSEKTPSQEATDAYENNVQSWNNWIFLCCMFSLYSIYYCMVRKLARGQSSKAAMSIFIQCSIICFFNTGTAIVYNVLSFVTPAPWILVFGQICWQSNHGCPALIYIFMNETIGRELKKLVFRSFKKRIEDKNAVGTSTNGRVYNVTGSL